MKQVNIDPSASYCTDVEALGRSARKKIKKSSSFVSQLLMVWASRVAVRLEHNSSIKDEGLRPE